jgi:hypothetical protein
MNEQEAHKVNELFKQIDEINAKYVDALETIRVLNDKIVEYADALIEATGCCNEKKKK